MLNARISALSFSGIHPNFSTKSNPKVATTKWCLQNQNPRGSSVKIQDAGKTVFLETFTKAPAYHYYQCDMMLNNVKFTHFSTFFLRHPAIYQPQFLYKIKPQGGHYKMVLPKSEPKGVFCENTRCWKNSLPGSFSNHLHITTISLK